MKKTKDPLYKFVPEMIGASDLQRKSKEIIDKVKESSQPYFVVRNNKPQMVLLNIEEYESLRKTREAWELQDTLEAIEEAEIEKKECTLQPLTGSMYDLWKKSKKEFKDD